MSWSITLLGVHVAFLFCLALLWRATPDWLQRLVLGLLMAAAMVFVIASLAELVGTGMHWLWKRVALEIEHVAVLLYIFRQIHVRYVCPTLSAHSHSLPRS